jgi:hypothetical protein
MDDEPYMERSGTVYPTVNRGLNEFHGRYVDSDAAYNYSVINGARAHGRFDSHLYSLN